MHRSCIIYGTSTLFVFAASAPAAPTFFTDRTAWENAVDSASIFTEDFNSEPNPGVGGVVVDLPYTTDGDVEIDGDDDIAAVQLVESGLVNGTQAPIMRDFGTMITWTPLSTGFGSFTAFGFDWDTAFETWNVIDDDGTTLMTLSPGFSEGFFGVTFGITDTQSSFTLTSPAQGQGGLSVDDLSFANVPAPGSVSLVGLACVSAMRRRR